MPVNWPTFINTVASKLESQTIQNLDEMGTFMAQQYFTAVANSQTPFSNKHIPGQQTILNDAFKRGFKMLGDSTSPTYEQKMVDPMYADLTEPLQDTQSYDANAQLIKWLVATKSKNFLSFDFGKVDAKITEADMIKVLADRILFAMDGEDSKKYLDWINRLNTGSNSLWAVKVKSTVLNLIKLKQKPTGTYNKQVFQSFANKQDQKTSPFITPELIAKYTYDAKIDGDINSDLLKVESLIPEVEQADESTRIQNKLNIVKSEEKDWKDVLTKWTQSEIDSANANKDEKAGADTDPFEVLAKGVLDYWKSTATQPFAQTPSIFPATIPAPGTYVPLTYGSQTRLADFLRRAWNTGKKYEKPEEKHVAANLVATAVAYALQDHLLHLKFIYNGQIYYGVGTAPMIGFVPFVI